MYAISEIDKWRKWMRSEILSEVSDKEVVGGGDLFKEVNTNYILDIQVVDKKACWSCIYQNGEGSCKPWVGMSQ